MMRIKLLSEPEYGLLHKERRGREYGEGQFYDLLREKGDFADEESLALLRHLHGEAVVAGKLYLRTTADGRPCLPAISREAMYGLVVIENSRKGIYTPIVESCMGSAVDEVHGDPMVWQAFAQMDMDILLTFRKKDFSFGWDIPIDEEFVLEQYPLHGVPTDVRVVKEYIREPELREGIWHIHNFFYKDKYRWSEDTEQILKELHNEFLGLPPLVKGVFTPEEFENMCRPQGFSDPYQMSCLQYAREAAFDNPCEAEQKGGRVVNHMDYLPEEGDSRRLLYLRIEEYADGHFCLGENISVKYPTYEEMFCEAQEMRKDGCELFVLPVDVNETMGRAADIRKAVCAFRVTEDVIETFGPAEGLREFERVLRRAVGSGTCQTQHQNEKG